MWRCGNCDLIYSENELLKAPNPFDKSECLTGCPDCNFVNDFSQICDAPNCKEDSTCGIPTKAEYRRVCGKHYRELSLMTTHIDCIGCRALMEKNQELLEAAKTIMKHWKALYEKSGGMAPNTLYSILEKAIAKAEGK